MTKTSIFGDHGWEGTRENFSPPSTISAEDRDEACRQLAEFNAYMAPAKRDRIIVRISVALSHWYVADMAGPIAKGILDDWAKDLGDYPEWAVEAALAFWRRTETKRPTIAAIRLRCEREIAKIEAQRRRLTVLASVRLKDDAAPSPHAGSTRGRVEATVAAAVKRMG